MLSRKLDNEHCVPKIKVGGLMRGMEVYVTGGSLRLSRLVWQGEGLGNELTWGTQDLTGLPLANGVYLWRVWVKVGEEWVVSAIQKLVILR
jgi:hypothetical protein